MKRSFLYPLTTSTMVLVMVVPDGTWLSLTQANILPILVNFYPFLTIFWSSLSTWRGPPCTSSCSPPRPLWWLFFMGPGSHWPKQKCHQVCKISAQFDNFMVISSYMKRSFLYPLPLYTLSLVMVVPDGIWLALTQPNILPSFVNFHPILTMLWSSPPTWRGPTCTPSRCPPWPFVTVVLDGTW